MAANVYYDADADGSIIRGRKVAIIGYFLPVYSTRVRIWMLIYRPSSRQKIFLQRKNIL